MDLAVRSVKDHVCSNALPKATAGEYLSLIKLPSGSMPSRYASTFFLFSSSSISFFGVMVKVLSSQAPAVFFRETVSFRAASFESLIKSMASSQYPIFLPLISSIISPFFTPAVSAGKPFLNPSTTGRYASGVIPMNAFIFFSFNKSSGVLYRSQLLFPALTPSALLRSLLILI